MKSTAPSLYNSLWCLALFGGSEQKVNMHMITRSCVLLLWSQLLTSVTCQDCTLQQFRNSDHFDTNFDLSGLDATYSAGKQVRVPCNVGYTGYFKLICTEGKWLPTGRKCEPKSCGHPGDAQFADFKLVVGDDYVFGSQIVYECNPGYHMVSRSSRRRCLANGWDGTIAVCEATKCPVVHADDNVQVLGDTEEATTGNVVRFSCKLRTQVLRGSPEIYCKDDGEWSGPAPKCEAIRCSVPQIEHGRVVGTAQEYQENEILNFRCDETYKRADERTPRCTKFAGKADWSPTPACKLIKCELPLASIPGTTYDPPYKNMFSPGETVRVTCGEKHWILDMQKTVADVTCGISGNWNTNHVCQEVTCPRYIDGAHLYHIYTLNKNILGDRVRYYCANNYEAVSSDNMAMCTREGWTPNPLCRGTQCENPIIENSRIARGRKRKYNNGDRLTYECLRGNQESVTITCERGAWVGIMPCPDGRLCQKPEIPNGFAVEPSKGTIYYACNEDFKLSTKSWWGHAKCEDGSFGQLYSCIERTSCGEAPAISNGKVTIIGIRAKIECNEGYDAQIPELTCNNGRWNYHGFKPKTICRETAEHCGPPPKVENAIVTISYQTEYLDGSSATYQCRDKYMMKEEEGSITCNAGKWEMRNITCVPFCDELSDPRLTVRPDMIKERYLTGDVVQYECAVPGANAGGNATCENGKWKTPEECPGVPCKFEPLSVGLRHDGSVSKTLMNPGEKLLFLCDDEYDMEGPDEVQCLDTGKWNEPFPTCSAKCRRPDIPENVRFASSVQGNAMSKGDTLSFACRQQGHIMRGNPTSRCLGDGQWSDPVPQCSEPLTTKKPAVAHCSAPPLLEDGDTKSIIGSDAIYQTGEKVEYVCQSTFTMQGDPFKTCNNGEWTGNMRCLKPCILNEELLSRHGLQFRYGDKSKLYAPHEGYISFACVSGKRHDGAVPMRGRCIDGQMPVPTCR